MMPWKCPRNLPESELRAKLETLAANMKRFETRIFNLYCPPYNSSIDSFPELDKTLKPVLSRGDGPRMVPAGSPSVRAAIEKHQPLLGFHGHIHESRGAR
jgi:Icc-related predicted phosphoesterase